MALNLLVDGRSRVLELADFHAYLEGHPPQVIEVAHNVAKQLPDELLLEAELGDRLLGLVRDSVAKAWAPVISATPPSPSTPPGTTAPVYQFIDVPPAGQTESPMLVSSAGVTKTYSSYRVADSEVAKVRDDANAFLNELAARGYELKLPLPADTQRRPSVNKLAGRWAQVLEAAQSYGVAQTHPRKAHLRLAPGAIPGPVQKALLDFVGQLAAHEPLNLELAKTAMLAMGFQAGIEITFDLESLAPFYETADERIEDELEDVLDGMSLGFDPNNFPGWWFDGRRLQSPTPLGRDDLESGAADHIVVPRLPLPPEGVPPPAGYLPATRSLPIALCLSDFHMGQGSAVDNADDVYPQLDRAFTEVLNQWQLRENQHRRAYGWWQPAHLVLHGDHLDFWSADMVPRQGSGNRFDPDVDDGGNAPIIDRAIAEGRMNRIIGAHQAFFDRVTAWVDSHPLNFVIYVCGNHDDHLVRYGLGAVLAARLHPSRGAFAAQDVFFPQLKTIIEHGHREDAFNATTLSGNLASLGELMVTMMVNPVERGGANYLVQLDANNQGSNVLSTAGLDQDDVDALSRIYGHLRRCYEVSPATYNAHLGCVDNLANGGLEDAVADMGGRELVRANRGSADDADVAELDSDVASLKAIWMAADFQELQVRAGARLTRVLRPSFQSYIVNEVFAGNQAEALGFEPDRGLHASSAMKVHVVGHTHDPSLTTPTISGIWVQAQHVNTGTGQDTWQAHDENSWDPFDLGSILAVEGSGDSLTPVQKSQYCLLYLLEAPAGRVTAVECGPFRTIQAAAPIDTLSRRIWGFLTRGLINFVSHS